jgi:hypothetical protein
MCFLGYLPIACRQDKRECFAAASLACAKRLVRCDAVVAAADSPSITAGESRLQEIVRVLQQKEGKCRAEIILLDII